ncbi:hypothetical protein QUF64_09925 [Anaerolineales bacterium HSG6]|nr:hypothetical protein [Anaerolineales bacterium HSG6]
MAHDVENGALADSQHIDWKPTRHFPDRCDYVIATGIWQVARSLLEGGYTHPLPSWKFFL